MKQTRANIRAIDEVETGLRLATLIAPSAPGYRLDDNGYQFDATVAFSCLVEPRTGDQVLYASAANGHNIIVSIVSRPGVQDMQLAFPQNASLSCRHGALQLDATQSLSLSSAQINTLSQTSIQKSTETYMQVGKFHFDGERANINIRNIMVISRVLSTMARQVVSKFQAYLRQSEDIDQVKAKNMTRSARGLLNMNAGHTVMLSKKDTKIDAERIHIG